MIKKKAAILISLILSIFFCDQLFANGRDYQLELPVDNNITLKIDERLELVSVVFRLAEAAEYMSCFSPQYINDINNYFALVKDHPLITFIQATRETHSFGYSIAAKSAFMINISRKGITLDSGWDYSLEFNNEYSLYWTKDIFFKYYRLLQDFYKESNFHSFYINHQDYYSKALAESRQIVSKINMDWFADFYGKDEVPVDIYLGLSIGGNNYSIHDITRHTYWDGHLITIIGTMENDNHVSSMSDDQLPIIVHEISHYYSSELLNDYYDDLSQSMEFVFSKTKEKMSSIGYSNARSIAGEWITDLFVNIYLYQNEGSNAYYVAENEKRGFIWMSRSVIFINNFLEHRNVYPSISDFMPQLVAFFNQLPMNWEIIETEYNHKFPYIVEIFPAGGYITSQTNEILITFSVPMLASVFGIMKSNPKDYDFVDFQKCYWKDEKTFSIKIKDNLPVDQAQFGIRLLSQAFISASYYTMKEDNILFFYFQNDFR